MRHLLIHIIYDFLKKVILFGIELVKHFLFKILSMLTLKGFPPLAYTLHIKLSRM
jgi:hypothetical protein